MATTNDDIARHLAHIAELLEAQDGTFFRVRSYRKAAETIRWHEVPIESLVRQRDIEALRALPGIGEKLSRLVVEYVERGHTQMMDRLEGEVSPEKLFMRLPGIGEGLAHRLVDELGIHSLEELELAAHDGRLSTLEGFGEKRIEGLKSTLAGLLSRSAQRRPRAVESRVEQKEPDVEILLDVDREYREAARANKLPKIAPRRFNPEGKIWLPILHTERGEWEFTALFSNTKRAHDLGKVDDWVVLYFESDGHQAQRTVVTETTGELAGKRVVRGREAACNRYYLPKSAP